MKKKKQKEIRKQITGYKFFKIYVKNTDLLKRYDLKVKNTFKKAGDFFYYTLQSRNTAHVIETRKSLPTYLKKDISIQEKKFPELKAEYFYKSLKLKKPSIKFKRVKHTKIVKIKKNGSVKFIKNSEYKYKLKFDNLYPYFVGQTLDTRNYHPKYIKPMGKFIDSMYAETVGVDFDDYLISCSPHTAEMHEEKLVHFIKTYFYLIYCKKKRIKKEQLVTYHLFEDYTYYLTNGRNGFTSSYEEEYQSRYNYPMERTIDVIGRYTLSPIVTVLMKLAEIFPPKRDNNVKEIGKYLPTEISLRFIKLLFGKNNPFISLSFIKDLFYAGIFEYCIREYFYTVIYCIDNAAKIQQETEFYYKLKKIYKKIKKKIIFIKKVFNKFGKKF